MKMKRIILLWTFLLFTTFAAKAANEYNAYINGDVTVTDQSTEMYGVMEYKYLLEFNQVGVNSGGTHYDSSVSLVIYPDGPSIAGSFAYDGGSGNIGRESFVQYGSNTRYVCDYNSGSTHKLTLITITDNKDGSYTISGELRTKQGSNSYYYYYFAATDPNNTFTPVAPDPYKDEPARKDFSINAEHISSYDQTASGRILIDLNTKTSDYLELCFLTDTFDIPAGKYTIDNSGAKGSIAASTGMGDYLPTNSHIGMFSGSYYFLVSGSVTVSYEGKTMNVSGTVTSGHGSVITVTATGDNPFYKEDPKTFELTVSSVGVKFNDDISKPNFELSIGATNGGNPCNGYIRLYTDTLAGDYDYNSIYAYSYMGKNASEGFNYLDTTSPEHSVKIEATGNPNEYKLNSSLLCEDRNTYIIKDFVFTYTPPSPYEAESDVKSVFDGTFRSTPYVYDESATNSRIIFNFNSTEASIDIAFAAKSKADILPARYPVSTAKTVGTVIASEGRIKVEGYPEDTPSIYGKGSIFEDQQPYYITGGYVDVSFIDGELVMEGALTTAKGSTIKLDARGANEELSVKLPANVMKGVIPGTGKTYTLAYEVVTEDNGSVTVSAYTRCSDGQTAVKPRIKVGEGYVDMVQNGDKPEYSYTTSATYASGTGLSFDMEVICGSGQTETKAIKYVVE